MLDISADSSESWITFSPIWLKGKYGAPPTVWSHWGELMFGGPLIQLISHFGVLLESKNKSARVCVGAATLGRGSAASSLFD